MQRYLCELLNYLVKLQAQWRIQGRPQWDPIFSFSQMFLPKITCVGGRPPREILDRQLNRALCRQKAPAVRKQIFVKSLGNTVDLFIFATNSIVNELI